MKKKRRMSGDGNKPALPIASNLSGESGSDSETRSTSSQEYTDDEENEEAAHRTVDDGEGTVDNGEGVGTVDNGVGCWYRRHGGQRGHLHHSGSPT